MRRGGKGGTLPGAACQAPRTFPPQDLTDSFPKLSLNGLNSGEM